MTCSAGAWERRQGVTDMFGKNALVVDDSSTARAVLKQRLSRFDVVTVAASDGKHALDMLRSHTPDVIFLDHVMPGLDGFEVLERLKGNRSTRGIPVVMYTSQAAARYIEEARSLGAIAVIPKNVSEDQLVDALTRAELYQMSAANSEQTAEERAQAAAEAGPASATTREALAEGAAPAPVAPAGAMPISPRRDEGFNRGRLAVAASIVAALLAVQVHALWRDQAQRAVIADLSARSLAQERQLQELRERLESQQSQLVETSSRQLELLVDWLGNR